MQLVQCVGGDPDGQEERGQRGGESVGVDRGGRGGAERDVAEMPGGVGRVKEGDEVAPATGRQGVEGGPAQPRVRGPGYRPGPWVGGFRRRGCL